MASQMRKGASFLALSTIFGVLTQLTQFVLLGRLLPEQEVGLASVVLVVIVFAQMLTDFGLSGYYVHRQSASKIEKSTLYWLNVLLGVFIAIVIMVISPAISSFYNEPALLFLLLLCALSFPVIAAGSQFNAVLLKSFNYKVISLVEIATRCCSLAIFILLILNDFGPLSIVLAHLTASITKTSILFFCVKREEWPSWVFDFKFVSGGLRYGGFVVLGQFLNQLSQNLDKVLIGKYLGMAELGVYTLAKDIAMKGMQVINPVLHKLYLPRYAKNQGNESLLKRDFGHSMLLTGFFSSLAFFTLSLGSQLFVEIFYGVSKAAVAEILMIVPFYVLFRSFGNIIGALLGATGNTHLDFKWNVIAFLLTTPCVFYLSKLTLTELAIGMALIQVVLTVLAYFILIKPVLEIALAFYLSRICLFPLIAAILMWLVSPTSPSINNLPSTLEWGIWLILYLAVGGAVLKLHVKKNNVQ